LISSCTVDIGFLGLLVGVEPVVHG
jgi:hypothetical protein